MPNVLMTERCVRSCPYCFAGRRLSGRKAEPFLSWEDLIFIADLHQKSGERNFRLLGGEPTLHPQFIEMSLYLLARGFDLQVFTSGILGERRLSELDEALQEIKPERVSFICNINEPELAEGNELARLEAFLDVFSSRITPGFNIYHPNFSIDFIFDYMNSFGLGRSMRIGMAHPILGFENEFVAPPSMRSVMARLVSFFPAFRRQKVRVGLDCGIPLCLFSREELGELYWLGGGEIRFGCSPAVDIGVDGTVWACFPLSEYHRRSLYEFDDLNEIGGFYNNVFEMVRVEASGIYEQCDICDHRDSGMCRGGCTAQILRMMQNEPPVRKLPTVCP